MKKFCIQCGSHAHCLIECPQQFDSNKSIQPVNS